MIQANVKTKFIRKALKPVIQAVEAKAVNSNAFDQRCELGRDLLFDPSWGVHHG